MSVVAEDDWLVHTISAYFQEYTAAFRENAFALYDRLETAYGLSGFFKGWKDHIGYDVNQTHADEFEELLTGEERVSQKALIRGVELAARTVEYLIGALDELSALKRDTPLRDFRTSPSLVRRGARRSTILGGIDDLSFAVESQNPVNLAKVLIETARRRLDNVSKLASAFDFAVTPRFLADIATRAMSKSVQHDDIILLGRIVEVQAGCFVLDNSKDAEEKIAAGSQAIRNFNEHQVTLFLLGLLDYVKREWHTSPSYGLFDQEFRESWPRRFAVCVPRDVIVRIATAGLQFVEIGQAASQRWTRVASQDLLLLGPRY
jgi:hypothetical protein